MCSLLFNYDLVNPQNYCEQFIFPLKHHTQSTESIFQYILTCSDTGISEEDASTPVSLSSINILPINCVILKQFKVSKRKGEKHITSGVGNNRQPISFQSKRLEISGGGKPPSRVQPKRDKG